MLITRTAYGGLAIDNVIKFFSFYPLHSIVYNNTNSSILISDFEGKGDKIPKIDYVIFERPLT